MDGGKTEGLISCNGRNISPFSHYPYRLLCRPWFLIEHVPQ